MVLVYRNWNASTITTRWESKKRMFRLINDEAIINRMGFNNEGVEAAILRLKKNRGILIGGNIGKNKTTPNEKAPEDYIYCYTLYMIMLIILL